MTQVRDVSTTVVEMMSAVQRSLPLRSPACKWVIEAKYGAVGCLCNSSRILLHAKGGGGGKGGEKREEEEARQHSGSRPREPHRLLHTHGTAGPRRPLTLCGPPHAARGLAGGRGARLDTYLLPPLVTLQRPGRLSTVGLIPAHASVPEKSPLL